MSSDQKPRVFLLDNVDSFTYNLVDELRAQGYDLTVYRNTVSARHILAQMQAVRGPVVMVLSPGPGAPADAGCMPELLTLIQGHFPVLGICLGHQAVVEHFGGTVDRADEVMHGKASDIRCLEHPCFEGLASPLPVARYHSLVAKQVPACLDVIADYNDMAMAVYHQDANMLGFQFHPESILTAQGSQLLKQSIQFLTQGAAL